MTCCQKLRALNANVTYKAADVQRLAHHMAMRRNGPTVDQTTMMAHLKQDLNAAKSMVNDHLAWCEQCNRIGD